MFENQFKKQKEQLVSSRHNLLINATIKFSNSNLDNNKYSRNNSNLDLREKEIFYSINKNSLDVPERPVTARSLPGKTQLDEEKISKPKVVYGKNNNNLDSSHNNLKLVSSTGSNKSIVNYLDCYKNINTSKNCSSNNNQSILNKINSPIKKTNLDYFIDYYSNPFTTKFELLGNRNENNNQNNNRLTINKVFRSHSTTNIVDNQFNNNNNSNNTIVSPSLVKPYTNVDLGKNKNNDIFHLTNNQSTNNYYGDDYDNDYEEDIELSMRKSISESTSLKNDNNEEFTNLSKLNNHKNSNEYVLNDKKNSISIEVNDLPISTKFFIRITDNLYIGNVKSITNERKLCKLNIEYLIDITNLRPEYLNRQSITKLPCLCKKQHSRINLSIEITDTSFKSLFSSFSEINKFILRARKSSNNRRVLIFGKEHLSPIALCACLQYLMIEYDLSLNESIDAINDTCSAKFNLDECFMNYLKQFETYLNHYNHALYGTNITNKTKTLNHNINNDTNNKSNSDRVQSQYNTSSYRNDEMLQLKTEINEDNMKNDDKITRIERIGSNKFKMAWM